MFRFLVCRIFLLGVVLPLTIGMQALFSDRDLVVFVLDDRLGTASSLYPGAIGMSQLNDIFYSLGARTRTIRLTDPIPEEARVVVIGRPLRPLPAAYLARLWVHLARGNHLLLAIDPTGHNEAITDDSASGLSQLLSLDYGVNLPDTFVVDPWFNRDTITEPLTTYSRVFAPDGVTHPILEPLVRYRLPVYVWGSRTITVDPFGVAAEGIPLLQSRSSYAEQSFQVFEEPSDTTSLELDRARGQLSPIVVGALAENRQTGSRIVVLGDSEMVQNGFGLAYSSYTDSEPSPDAFSVYIGNYIFVQRLAAWLLGTPTDKWPPLPSGFTWIAIDGDGSDWTAYNALALDENNEASSHPESGIVSVKAIYDDAYLYLFVESFTPPTENTVVRFSLNPGLSSDDKRQLLITDHNITLLNTDGTGLEIPDARMASREAVEIQLPVRITGTGSTLSEICLYVEDTQTNSEMTDCISMAPTRIPITYTRSPQPIQTSADRIVMVASYTRVYLHETPDVNGRRLTIVPDGHLFEAVGRDKSGEWIWVRDAQQEGWISSSSLLPSGDLMTITVVDEPNASLSVETH